MNDGHIIEALTDGTWDRTAAVDRLMESSGLGERSCQKALSPESRFSHLFTIEGKWIRLADVRTNQIP
jgi:hypothetical protein